MITLPFDIRIEAECLDCIQPFFTDQSRVKVPCRGRKHALRVPADLTVADLEQMTEHHTRAARHAVERFNRRPSGSTVKTAGKHIWWARWARRKYHERLGVASTEGDMPFSSVADGMEGSA